ncbi:MAG: plasmid pRiA4b ORF-3 family protein [Thioalkalivibrio sp.]|nr:plasmid pRiA4b ORF-3 family protein [Thioalkalivibrio sp.]
MSNDALPRPPARRGRKPRLRLLQLRITLAEIEPPVWRVVRVPDAYTLHQLHRVLQIASGWLDYHLYMFQVCDRRFEEPLEDAADEDATAVHLRDLGLGKGARLTYTYDFGDDWVHEIVVQGVHAATGLAGDPPLPVLSGGERAGPPEDCGGPYSYAEMLQALADPDHPEHESYRLWAGDYDPERFDLRAARNSLTLAAAWGAI